ncbi:hypothetical protein WJX72_001050 [[Myrmecia] bisecta]|uniref:Uncharacterized protein n=1 Tax=[Myrmecia] bisecta TaxID=41462 RepID=A0AAW1Q2H5_9CHLO
MASYALPSHVAGNDSKRKAFQVQGVEAPPGKQSRLARQANSGQCAGGAAMPAGVGSPAAKRDESSPTPPCQTPDSQQHSQHPKQRHKQHKGGIRAVDQSQLEPARVQSAEAMRKTGCGISAFTAIPKKPPQAAPQPEAPAPAQLQCESIGSEASKSSLEGSGGNSTAAPNADPRHDSGELSGSKPPAWVPKQTAAAAGLLLSLSRHSM